MMLDDLRKIHERDKQDALGIIAKQVDQYLHDFHFSWTPPRDIYEVIVAGMGGSGLGAKAYKNAPGLQVPFEVIQAYELPDRVTENSLLICSSYSGNTEETISVLKRALDTEGSPYPRPIIVVIASGGELLRLARDNDLPYVELPSGVQPRYTLGYQYRALAEIFAATSLQDNFIAVLEAAARKLQPAIEGWLPTIPIKDNLAKQLALELMGKSVVINAGYTLAPAAYKWKISINENAKQIAWWNQLSELDHNELIGWTKQPEQKPYALVELHSSFDHPRIVTRFALAERMLSGLRPHPNIIEPVGDSLLEQMLYASALADFVSIYLALVSNIDPTPVDFIERFKQSLDE